MAFVVPALPSSHTLYSTTELFKSDTILFFTEKPEFYQEFL